MPEIFFLLYINQLAAGLDAGHWACVGVRACGRAGVRAYGRVGVCRHLRNIHMWK
jgi:hypothetical protein